MDEVTKIEYALEYADKIANALCVEEANALIKRREEIRDYVYIHIMKEMEAHE